MEWFIIENDTGENIGKEYPQTEFMSPGYNLHAENSVWNIPNVQVPEFEPNLDYFTLSKKAKLTDAISTGFISATGFLINAKLKEIFQQFNLPSHKYYSAKIMYKNTVYVNYFWLHFNEGNSNLIDYENSEFELKDPLPFFQKEIIKIEKKGKEYLIELRKRNSGKALFPTKIKFKNPHNYSLLIFSFLWNKVYISSDLKNELFKNNVSGLEIRKSEMIITN